MTAPPQDDLARNLEIARPEDPALVHLAVVGDTYTVLLSGEQTAGRFAMLDMLIPPGGGPPPHRHDFEECFRVLEGSLEVPAEVPARLLCTVAPSGLERYFAEFGDPVPSRTSPAPPLSDAERQERLQQAIAKAPEYGMGILPPPAT
jgi:hypothetical protein